MLKALHAIVRFQVLTAANVTLMSVNLYQIARYCIESKMTEYLQLRLIHPKNNFSYFLCSRLTEGNKYRKNAFKMVLKWQMVFKPCFSQRQHCKNLYFFITNTELQVLKCHPPQGHFCYPCIPLNLCQSAWENFKLIPFGNNHDRSRRKEDNIKISLTKNMVRVKAVFIQSGQCQRRDIVNTNTSLQVPYNSGEFLTSQATISFSGMTLSVDVVINHSDTAMINCISLVLINASLSSHVKLPCICFIVVGLF